MLILTRTDIRALMGPADYLEAVETAMRLYSLGSAIAPGMLHADARMGEFHIKTGGLYADAADVFGAKLNGGFFGNRKAHGLPNILGVIYVCDASNGLPLALMESTEITTRRTAAATTVAARHLACAGARRLAVIGTGNQARAHVAMMREVFDLERVYLCGRSDASTAQAAEELASELALNVLAVPVDEALRDAELCVTCTTAREVLVRLDQLAPGTFVAAVGADSPGKQELDPRIPAACKVVTDVTSQCLEVGELQHALKAGLMSSAHVHAEIGEVIVGAKPGRESSEEIILYDSTGTALQDVAAASTVFQKALEGGRGLNVELFG